MEAIVEQIHREFLTSSEVMLETYSSHKDRMMEKIERLGKLGFENCADAQKLPVIRDTEVLTQLINQYSISHPNNKIISKRDVSRICDKYNLVYDELHRFTGFVPDKNLKEIESFYHKDYKTFLVTKSTRWAIEETIDEFFTEYAAKEKLQELNGLQAAERIERSSRSLSSAMEFIINERATYSMRRKADFIIAAPLKDMLIKRDETIENGEIKAAPVHYPDPVVLFPIHQNFYLIVTAWGDEASDPLVVNEKMN